MADPADDTLPGLGPQKPKLNKKVILAVAAAAGAAVTVLWPQYAPLIDQLRKALGF